MGSAIMEKITIKSDLNEMKKASAKLMDFIKANASYAHNDLLFDIKLCLEEAVRNAIVHGNKDKLDLPVDISYNIIDNKINITVTDQGNGFDPKILPNCTDEKNLYKESGRGVYIIHRLMDEVTYNTKGNSITMVKSLR